MEGDLEDQRGRESHDDVAGGGRDTVGVDHHGIAVLLHRPDRRAEPHRVAEVVGHALRHRPGPAVDQVLLRPTFDREQRLQAPVGPHEEEEVEEGRVLQVPGEEAPHGHLEQVTGHRGADARAP